MDKWIEASELPENEKVYLKKDILGWRVISPYKDKDTGKINWGNLLFGGRRNLVVLIFLLILFLLAYLGVKELVSNYQQVADNPCAFCKDCQAQCRQVVSATKLKTIEINLTGLEVVNNEEG